MQVSNWLKDWPEDEPAGEGSADEEIPRPPG